MNKPGQTNNQSSQASQAIAGLSAVGQRRKVLIVSYVFPPMAAVGIYRILKFCKYLPQFGWDPVVLTVRKGANFSYDHSQLDKLDPSMPVYRSGNFEPLIWWNKRSQRRTVDRPVPAPTAKSAPSPASAKSSWVARFKRGLRHLISTPDANIYWVPFGLITGLRAIRRERIDAILSSSPPASAHILAWLLSKLSGKPMVVDFRDLWTQNESYELSDRPPLVRKLDRSLERRVLRRAAAIVNATEPFAEMTRANNPSVTAETVHAITNGLDPDDFVNIVYPTTKNSKFTILHLGSLYGHRNPAFFFEAVTELLRRRPETGESLEIQFVGNVPGFDKVVVGTPLEKVTNFVGHVPQDKALNKLWEADLLLLILGFSKSTGATIPAKLFEYIATGRPMLSFVPEGEAARLITKYQAGIAVTSPDIEKTVGYLLREFDAWQARTMAPESRFSLPAEFDRKAQAATLAGILTDICPAASAPRQ
jgi:glycosyltransferase involved in cell wall biosynthesis